MWASRIAFYLVHAIDRDRQQRQLSLATRLSHTLKMSQDSWQYLARLHASYVSCAAVWGACRAGRRNEGKRARVYLGRRLWTGWRGQFEFCIKHQCVDFAWLPPQFHLYWIYRDPAERAEISTLYRLLNRARTPMGYGEDRAGWNCEITGGLLGTNASNSLSLLLPRRDRSQSGDRIHTIVGKLIGNIYRLQVSLD